MYSIIPSSNLLMYSAYLLIGRHSPLVVCRVVWHIHHIHCVCSTWYICIVVLTETFHHFDGNIVFNSFSIGTLKLCHQHLVVGHCHQKRINISSALQSVNLWHFRSSSFYHLVSTWIIWACVSIFILSLYPL